MSQPKRSAWFILRKSRDFPGALYHYDIEEMRLSVPDPRSRVGSSVRSAVGRRLTRDGRWAMGFRRGGVDVYSVFLGCVHSGLFELGGGF